MGDQEADREAKLEKALRLCLDTLTDERIGKSRYMEGWEIYEDFNRAAEAARKALS